VARHPSVNPDGLIGILNDGTQGSVFTKQLLICFNTIKPNLLKSADYWSTLVLSISSPQFTLFFVFGDGGIAIINEKGARIFRFEFNKGAPFYLENMNDPDYYFSRNCDAEGRVGFVSEYKAGIFDADYNILDAGVPVEVSGLYRRDVEHGYSLLVKNESNTAVCVFSDGMFDMPEGKHWLDAIASYLHFKAPKGVFVKRRCMRVIEKENFASMDDFSLAVTQLDDLKGVA
jgi:hypothetical protein